MGRGDRQQQRRDLGKLALLGEEALGAPDAARASVEEVARVGAKARPVATVSYGTGLDRVGREVRQVLEHGFGLGKLGDVDLLGRPEGVGAATQVIACTREEAIEPAGELRVPALLVGQGQVVVVRHHDQAVKLQAKLPSRSA
jgi:hypothetical protein